MSWEEDFDRLASTIHPLRPCHLPAIPVEPKQREDVSWRLRVSDRDLRVFAAWCEGVSYAAIKERFGLARRGDVNHCVRRVLGLKRYEWIKRLNPYTAQRILEALTKGEET